MTFAKRGWDGLLAVLYWSTMVVLFFMMVSIFYDAVMRYAFSAPTSWSLEVNSFLLVFLAVIGAAEAQKQDAHIRITFFVDKMPARVRLAIAFVGFLIGVVFCAIMTWRGILLAADAYEYGERVSSALGTPMVFPYGLLPAGFGALTLQFLINAVQTALEWGQPDRAPGSSDG